MCYHVSTPAAEEIAAYDPKLDIKLLLDSEEVYHHNAFARPALPVQTTEQPKVLQPGQWGLVPNFIKDLKDMKFHTFNARGETIYDTASYKNNIGTKRALLWVNGFYEFYAKNKSNKIPHFIHMPEKRPFTMGCVYNVWHDIVTISIITVKGNDLLTKVHNKVDADGNPDPRMPLIIPEKDRYTWLGELSKEEIQGLMQPYPDGELSAHTISKDLTKRKGKDGEPINSNQPYIQEKVEY